MKKNNKWLMFLILLISAITVGVSQLKIAAVMQDVAAALGVSTTQAALLMSVFTIAGIVLAIPGAAIQDKMGPKNLLLLLMACLAAGNVLGAVSGSFAVVVVSRIIEGISYAMIIMVGVTMINTWFADGGASTATGIFNTFAAVANFIAMNASIPIMKTMGLKSLWWVVAGLSALCLVLVAMFIQAPRAASEGGDNSKATIGEAMANLRVDVLSLAMFCIAFVLFGFITCYPQLFQGYYGLTAETANFYSSLNGLFGIPFCILCGVLVEKTGKPFVIAIIGAVGHRPPVLYHALSWAVHLHRPCAGQRNLSRRPGDDLHLLPCANAQQAACTDWIFHVNHQHAVLHRRICLYPSDCGRCIQFLEERFPDHDSRSRRSRGTAVCGGLHGH